MELKIDGVELQNLAWNVEDRGGRWAVPGKENTNIVIPGRSGVLYRGAKTHGAGSILLSMWVRGCQPDGTMPVDRTPAQRVRDNIDKLTRLFTKASGLLEVVQYDDQNGARRCYAETVQSIDFSSAPGNMASFAVELHVPGAFWEDTTATSFVGSAGITTGTNVGITGLAGGTAVIEDATITFRGAGTSPKLTDVTTGAWIQLSGSVASGTDWVINNSAYTSVNNGSQAVASTTHGPVSRLLPLQPHPVTGDVVVKVEGSGFNANTRLSVSGRRKWLIA